MISSNTVSFGLDQSGSTKLQEVLLEQEDWPKDLGKITKMNLARYVIQMTQPEFADLDITVDPPSAICTMNQGEGGNGGVNSIATRIYAYVVDPTMPFQIETTSGDLYGDQFQWVEKTEVLSFTGSKSADFKYPCNALESIKFQGKVYNLHREEVFPSTVFHDSRSISMSEPIYGTLRVKFRSFRHIYVLVIPERAEAKENKFDAVVYAYYKGGVTWLSIKMPGYSAYSSNNSDALSGYLKGSTPCGQSTLVSVTSGDGVPNPPKGANKDTTVDYCSQKTLSVSVG